MDPSATTTQAETRPSVPPSPPDGCSVMSIPIVNFSDYSLPPGQRFCQINWPEYEPELLSSCCGNDSEVLVQDNCTQFCLTNRTNSEWSQCLRDTILPNNTFGYGCNMVPEDSWAASPVGPYTALAPLMLVAVVLFGRIL